MEVVLPNGQFVTANATSNPDLFWALRGGGGGKELPSVLSYSKRC
jgi:hypothetical protein